MMRTRSGSPPGGRARCARALVPEAVGCRGALASRPHRIIRCSARAVPRRQEWSASCERHGRNAGSRLELWGGDGTGLSRALELPLDRYLLGACVEIQREAARTSEELNQK